MLDKVCFIILRSSAQCLDLTSYLCLLNISSLLKGKRAVLAGDHCQLPPTIKSTSSEVQRELGKTLFQRLMNAYDKDNTPNKPSKMLEVQYRMHEDIAEWARLQMRDRGLMKERLNWWFRTSNLCCRWVFALKMLHLNNRQMGVLQY